jgi:hypothetical protein
LAVFPEWLKEDGIVFGHILEGELSGKRIHKVLSEGVGGRLPSSKECERRFDCLEFILGGSDKRAQVNTMKGGSHQGGGMVENNHIVGGAEGCREGAGGLLLLSFSKKGLGHGGQSGAGSTGLMLGDISRGV